MRGMQIGFLRLYAAASLKPSSFARKARKPGEFSAALCRSLIEAKGGGCLVYLHFIGFLRLYAAASLKLPWRQSWSWMS